MGGMLVGIGLAALAGLWQSPVSVVEIFFQPFHLLRGSQRQLNVGLIEISEHIEPASRRLLKPFGQLHLIRSFNPKDPADPQR